MENYVKDFSNWFNETKKEIETKAQQQLLESLSEEIDGMYEKCPCGKFNCHGQGNDDALNEVKALIQSKIKEL